MLFKFKLLTNKQNNNVSCTVPSFVNLSQQKSMSKLGLNKICVTFIGPGENEIVAIDHLNLREIQVRISSKTGRCLYSWRRARWMQSQSDMSVTNNDESFVKLECF